MKIQLKRNCVQILAVVILIPCVSNGQQQNKNFIDNHNVYSNDLSDFDRIDRNDVEYDEQQYFNNYVYLEVWGHSWFSLNYFRFLKSPNILIGGGIGGNLDARNFTLGDGGGEIIQLFLEKQFKITKRIQYGFGIGATHDFAGVYKNFFDPFYLKASINRYSISLAEDKLYCGISIYYQKWDNWAVRPGARLGISF